MNAIELHKELWLRLQARRERLPHALLLTGQRGLGKFDLAQAFAASLLCESPSMDGLACGRCLACNWYSQGNHPDFRLLRPEAMAEAEEGEEEGKKKASQQITIDQVRGLDDFMNVGTHRSGLRIILVNPAEAMNRNTANSLLKVLEEPSPGTLFLLISNEPMRLLPTIRSRCQVVPVSMPSPSVASAVLAREGVGEADHWLALAGGAPKLAIELAASGQAAWLEQLLRQLSLGGQVDPLAAAGELEKTVKDAKSGIGLKALVEWLQKWAVDLTLAGNGLPVRYFLRQQATIARLTASLPSASLTRFYRKTLVWRREAEQPLNGRLFLESLFMDYRALFAS